MLNHNVSMCVSAQFGATRNQDTSADKNKQKHSLFLFLNFMYPLAPHTHTQSDRQTEQNLKMN